MKEGGIDKQEQETEREEEKEAEGKNKGQGMDGKLCFDVAGDEA